MLDSCDPSLFVTAAAFILACTLWLIHRNARSSGTSLLLPPLVSGLPFLGNIFGIDKKRPHITFVQFYKRYGGVFRLRILGQDTVVVSSRAAIREVLLIKDAQFAGRPYIFRIDYGFHYNKDIIFGDYSTRWQALKKLAARYLRQYGSAAKHVEDIVSQEMEGLVAVITDHYGKPHDPGIFLLTTVVNAITATVLGRRYEYTDPQMQRYKATCRLFSEACSAMEGAELDFFPWLRFLPNKTFRKLTEAQRMLDQLIDKELELCKIYHDPSEPRCIVDALMSYTSRDVTGETELTEADIRSIIIDLVVSGTLTTSITLYALLLILTHHDTVQDRLRAEVDKVLADRKFPTVADRASMPYAEAVILEILRYISHVPLCLPHKATVDTSVAGYYIPQGTQVLINLWALHHDDNLWGDPWCFRPERWISDEGKLLPPESELRKSLLPFGGGKRLCLGETLARERIFMFLTCIIRHFRFKFSDEKEKPSCDPRDFELGLILEPKPYELIFTPR